jgi:hypothetical protein
MEAAAGQARPTSQVQAPAGALVAAAVAGRRTAAHAARETALRGCRAESSRLSAEKLLVAREVLEARVGVVVPVREAALGRRRRLVLVGEGRVLLVRSQDGGGRSWTFVR